MGKFFEAIEKTQNTTKISKEEQDYQCGRSMSCNDNNIINNIKDVDKRLIVSTDTSSFEAEQIRILKTNILAHKSGVIPRTILVTSAVPYEGKSFIASNLAISLAQSLDQYSILVDCDLRMPSIHRLFGYNVVPGLSDCLNEGECISKLLLKTTTPKLSLLPAGNLRKNPSELLSSKNMIKLINEVKNRYDDRLVIFDSPPPSLASETKAISKHVDGIVLVMKLGSTKRELILELIESLGREKIIGIVVNWYDMRSLLSFLYGKYSKYERYYRRYHNTKEK